MGKKLKLKFDGPKHEFVSLRGLTHKIGYLKKIKGGGVLHFIKIVFYKKKLEK